MAAPVRRQRGQYAVPGELVTAHAHGISLLHPQGRPCAGSGVVLNTGNDAIAGRVPGPHQTAQAADIYAVSLALAHVEPYVALTICTTSKLVLDGLTALLPRWEDRAWMGVQHELLFKDVVARMRARSAPTYLKRLDAKSLDRLSELAIERAKAAANWPAENIPPLLPWQAERLESGMRLRTLSQKLAYHKILHLRGGGPRRKTTLNLDRIIDVGSDHGQLLTPALLWKSLYAKDLRRTMRDFWWLAMHDALRIGSYWENIPGYEQRARCSHCEVTESLEHIWMDCAAPGQTVLWALAQYVLKRRGATLPNTAFGLLLAAPALRAKTVHGTDTKGIGATRLQRIVMTETGHLIWKLRCERVIARNGDRERYHSKLELANRFFSALNKRLRLDQILVRPAMRADRLQTAVVLDTWRGTLNDELALPEDWTAAEGVLVGRPSSNFILSTG
ncbi:hypothetical protein GY45DRAFT_1397284 [Cubamyces sp. BRFM 1775]|nr:hypothetical protein GY45DRAFT_1397284 [Cubamyces sp. BRFM 1775]